ncbi:amine oxidase [Aspergillus venezuelensis]
MSFRDQRCNKEAIIAPVDLRAMQGGAGVAGIRAAQALSGNGVDDFVIIEFQDRIGGRMHDSSLVQGTQTGDGPENPINALANKYDITTLVTDQHSLITFDDQGPVGFKYAIDEFNEALDRVLPDAGALLQNNLQDRTFRAAFRYADWNPAKNYSYRQTAEWWLFDGEFDYSPGESSEIYTSVAENATFKYYSEDNLFVYDQRGFATIIREEAQSFLGKDDDHDHLRLNTQFTRIEYTVDSVTVHTNDGSCVEADYAISTLSLGVLQHKVVEFEPPLSDWKVAAISSFELDTYTKTFMQFNEPFWDEVQYLIYADPETRGWYPEFQPLDLPGVLEGSGLMVATVVNDQSCRVEAQANEETQAEVMEVLRSMYGEDIPDPTHLWYKHWTQTEWTYGSYSNWPPAISLQSHQSLRANLGNLFFAGEATSKEFFGYLQGAYLEEQYTGEFIASCLHGSDNCTLSDDQVNYPVLTGVTPYNLYNWDNGWVADVFAKA